MCFDDRRWLTFIAPAMDSGIQDVNLQYLCRIHSKVKKYAKKTFDRDRVMFFLSIMPADEYDQPSNSPINIHKENI